MSPMSMCIEWGNPPDGDTVPRSASPSAPPNMMAAPSGDHCGAAPLTRDRTETRSPAVSICGAAPTPPPVCAGADRESTSPSAAAPIPIRTRCIRPPRRPNGGSGGGAPGRSRFPRGRVLRDLCGHFPQQVSVGHRLPAVTFHRTSIAEIARVVRVACGGEEVLEHVDGGRQIEIVHVAGQNVELADELGTDARPVLFRVVPQVVSMITHVRRHGRVDLAGPEVEELPGIAVVADRPVRRIPD